MDISAPILTKLTAAAACFLILSHIVTESRNKPTQLSTAAVLERVSQGELTLKPRERTRLAWNLLLFLGSGRVEVTHGEIDWKRCNGFETSLQAEQIKKYQF